MVCERVTMLQFGRSSSFSENVQNSWTAGYILIKLLYYILGKSVVNNIVVLPLAIKRFISQEEISPFSQNYFKIVETVMMSHFLLFVRTNFYHHKRHILSGYTSKRIERHLKQLLLHRGMLIYRYQNVGIGGWLFQAKGNV